MKIVLNRSTIGKFLPFIFFLLLGLYLNFFRLVGLRFENIVGELGDTRFNQYVLEHFYRFMIGLEPSYWSPRIFYPYPFTIALSDNLLGSAPIYALFRSLGFNFYLSFDLWMLVGLVLNFVSAYLILQKLELSMIASGIGAFFFAFGLPVAAVEIHSQLLYRFCIPLLFYSYFDFDRHPTIWKLPRIAFWLTWQVYLSIYLGVFAIYMLLIMFLLLPLDGGKMSMFLWLRYWWEKLTVAFDKTKPGSNLIATILFILISLSLGGLMYPYIYASQIYKAQWQPGEIMFFLPTLRNYFSSEISQLWVLSGMQGWIGRRDDILVTDQQIFPGVVAILATLLVIGGLLVKGFEEKYRKTTALFLSILATLFLFTLRFGNISFYILSIVLPGFNSIRVVTRVILLFSWFFAYFIGLVWDAFGRVGWRSAPVFRGIFLILLVAETAFIFHSSYAIQDSEQRITSYLKTLPATKKTDDIYISHISTDNRLEWIFSEIDRMLAAQKEGLYLEEGYTGYFPNKYFLTDRTCGKAILPIKDYAEWVAKDGTEADELYRKLMSRLVTVGFQDCKPEWWREMPSTSELLK